MKPSSGGTPLATAPENIAINHRYASVAAPPNRELRFTKTRTATGRSRCSFSTWPSASASSASLAKRWSGSLARQRSIARASFPGTSLVSLASGVGGSAMCLASSEAGVGASKGSLPESA